MEICVREPHKNPFRRIGWPVGVVLCLLAGEKLALPQNAARAEKQEKAAERPRSGAAEKRLPQWVDEVQTYGMLPLLPDDAKKLHCTVNGLWAGIGGTNPILPHTEHVPAVRAKYGDDAAKFAADSHAAGLRVCAAVNGLEGMASLRATTPNLDAMACRKADGQPAVMDDGMTLMCTNNPAWLRWEIDRGRKAIDAGADLILVDTPMSSSFVSGFLKAGFCDHCLDNFRKHLIGKYSAEEQQRVLGLAGFDKATVVKRLSPLQQVTAIEDSPHVKTDAASRLFQEFIAAQEDASFATRQTLFGELRTYADKRGAAVALATNAADLGTQNPGGHWIRGIMFADLVDLFAYELNADPHGAFGAPLAPLPRGKWAAFHKLAYSIHGRRSAAVIHASNMGQLLQSVLTGKASLNSWLAAQTAEAYASNGAYTIYQVGVPIAQGLLQTRCWAKAATHNQFVLSHRDLYEGPLRSGSSLALLFLFNDRGRTIPAVFPSYLGLAQGFVETNHAFDVVFAGDDKYVRDRLAPASLAPYKTIVIPSPIRPTDNQKRVVQDFVSTGGVVVCLEPELLGLIGGTLDPSPHPDSPHPDLWWRNRFQFGKGTVIVLSGKVTKTNTTDIGSRFFRDYSRELRAAIDTMAKELGQASLLVEHKDGLLAAFPITQPDRQRLVIHLVNYDVDDSRDEIRTKRDVKLTVPTPAQPSTTATVHHSDGRSETLAISIAEGKLELVVPTVKAAAAVVIGNESPTDRAP